MATHSSILAWRIPWTEEPGGLQSMGSHRIGHEVTLHASLEVTWLYSSLIICHLLRKKEKKSGQALCN